MFNSRFHINFKLPISLQSLGVIVCFYCLHRTDSEAWRKERKGRCVGEEGHGTTWSAEQRRGEDPNNTGLRQKHSSTTVTGPHVPEAPRCEPELLTGDPGINNGLLTKLPF